MHTPSGDVCKLTHSLCRRVAAAGGRGEKSRPASSKRTDHPSGWSVLLLASMTDLDARIY